MKTPRIVLAVAALVLLPLSASAQEAMPRPGNVAPPMVGTAAVAQPPMRPYVAPLSEPVKIEALIISVEQLPGAVFIRNGSEYSADKAADHLRMKLRYAGKRIKTAEEFIDNLATGSSMSGKPYRIRFADGHTVESAVYFREQLRRIETGHRAAAATPRPATAIQRPAATTTPRPATATR